MTEKVTSPMTVPSQRTSLRQSIKRTATIGTMAMVLLMHPAWASNSVWYSSTIKKIYPLASGEWIIIFDIDSPSCTSTDGYHRVKVGANSVTQEGSRNMLSVALAAAAAGKTIVVNFDATTPSCYINRISVGF
ncbi:MAG: hypothetical protein AAF525_05485 [Pseudomonadota bacterium]